MLHIIGVCDVSKESIQWILTKKGKGNVAIIVVGGAEESLEAKPGTYNLTLLKRKGFVKQAIRTGYVMRQGFSNKNLMIHLQHCSLIITNMHFGLG